MSAPVERARAVLGTRYRLHGRDPAGGLDCAGLVAWAFGVAALPSGYAMRTGAVDLVMTAIVGAGLRRVTRPAPGDLMLVEAGPGQLHLGVWTGTGMVHADALARRVVERPGPPPWPVLGYWRRDGGE